MVEAFIFDFDGVLADTEPFVGEALQKAIEQLAGAPPDPEQFRLARLEAMHVGEHELFPVLCKGVGLSPVRATELHACYHTLFCERIQEKGVNLFPGAERLIRHLALHGIAMSIATNTSRETFNMKRMHHSETLGLIQHTVTLKEVGGREYGKPHPYMFQWAARAMNVPAAACMVIEDSPKGIEGARRAGMRAVGIASTLAREHLAGASVILNSLAEFDPAMWGLPAF